MEDSNNIKDSKHNYLIKLKKKTLNNYIDYLVLTLLLGPSIISKVKNKDLSEKFISANILLSKENKEEFKNLFRNY